MPTTIKNRPIKVASAVFLKSISEGMKRKMYSRGNKKFL
jgi:hypothetical protein